MNQAELYSISNKHAEGVNLSIVKKYKHVLTWQENESILDIGTGLGNTMKHILFPFLPKNFGEIICSDISEEMLEFARTNFQHPKVSYLQLDITTEDLPSELENRFHHIFSFFCFHWVQNPKQAMNNIYRMLKPGGEMFISFMERNPFDQPYENLSKYERWAKYGHELFISPFHRSDDSYEGWKCAVNESAPFQDCAFYLDDVYFEYANEQEFDDLWTAVNPIYNNIPEEDKKDYQCDHMYELKKQKDNFIPMGINGQAPYRSNFRVLTIFGRKPSQIVES